MAGLEDPEAPPFTAHFSTQPKKSVLSSGSFGIRDGQHALAVCDQDNTDRHYTCSDRPPCLLTGIAADLAVNLERLNALLVLRYRLLWAHVRSRNGRIALLMAAYFAAACFAVVFALGGLAAAAAAIHRWAEASTLLSCSWPESS